MISGGWGNFQDPEFRGPCAHLSRVRAPRTVCEMTTCFGAWIAVDSSGALTYFLRALVRTILLMSLGDETERSRTSTELRTSAIPMLATHTFPCISALSAICLVSQQTACACCFCGHMGPQSALQVQTASVSDDAAHALVRVLQTIVDVHFCAYMADLECSSTLSLTDRSLRPLRTRVTPWAGIPRPTGETAACAIRMQTACACFCLHLLF